MTACEIECRVSWANAALRWYGRELDVLHETYAAWCSRHSWLCAEAGSRGLKFANL
jgi:hypothetical protein